MGTFTLGFPQVAGVFRIKICGITSAEDMRAAADAGADAIGLNFYEKSSRYVEPSQALNLVKRGGHGVQMVGVFVNAGHDLIQQIRSRAKLAAVQLHGEESPDFISRLPSHPVIRARRMDDRGVAAIAEERPRCL